MLRKEIAGLKESIGGYQAQLKSTEERLALFTEELKAKKSLLDRQLARKTEVLALQRAEAGVSGERGELIARIADSKERIARAEQQITQLRSAAMQKAVEELRETETERDDLSEQIRAEEDVLRRLDVRAPVRGDRRQAQPSRAGRGGGARLRHPRAASRQRRADHRGARQAERHHARAGRPAGAGAPHRAEPAHDARHRRPRGVRLGRRRRRPGTPSSMPRSHCAPTIVHRAREARPGGRAQQDRRFHATPGMPADVYIKTGERTFVEYMMRPLLDSVSRGFREP